MALTDIQSAFLEGALLVGQLFGVGGSSWTRTRTSGSGETAAPSTATGTITGYVRRMKRTRMVIAQAGAAVPDDQWTLTAESDQDIRPRDRITSVADSGLTFVVTSREVRPGYVICILEAA